MTKRLGRQEWIGASLKAMASGGADAVRVERLADSLDVTKGSFYWHFKDRGELLAATLAAWQALATQDIIAHVEARGGTAAERLHTLFAGVLQSSGRLDLAIRSWADQDAGARAAVAEVDAARLGYLAQLFGELGFSQPHSRARAHLVYHALIGQFTMGDQRERDQRSSDYLDIVLPMLVRRT
jgi:AcrR family transcriptional regulator